MGIIGLRNETLSVKDNGAEFLANTVDVQKKESRKDGDKVEGG